MSAKGKKRSHSVLNSSRLQLVVCCCSPLALGDGSRPRPSGASFSSGFTQSRKSPSSRGKKKKKAAGSALPNVYSRLPTGERPRGESEEKLLDRSLLACMYPTHMLWPYRELQNLLVQSFRRFETSPGLCRWSRFAKSFGGGGARRKGSALRPALAQLALAKERKRRKKASPSFFCATTKPYQRVRLFSSSSLRVVLLAVVHESESIERELYDGRKIL